MDLVTSPQFWVAILFVAILAYLLGRAARGARDGDGALHALRNQALAAEKYASLPADRQVEIDRLLTEGQLIDAIKLIREETGLGLKEAKDAADARRRTLKG